MFTYCYKTLSDFLKWLYDRGGGAGTEMSRVTQKNRNDSLAQNLFVTE